MRWYVTASVLFGLLGGLPSGTAQGACESPSGNSEFRAVMDAAKAKAYYDMDLDAAILTLNEAEALLPCFNALIPTSDLTSFYLNKGALLNDVGRTEDGLEAIKRAASVSARIRFDDPSLDKATYMAFLSERDSLFLMDRPSLSIQTSQPNLLVAVDGQPISTQGVSNAFVPGWHFIQVGQGGDWTGTWVAFPSGGLHALEVTPEGATIGAWDGAEHTDPPTTDEATQSPQLTRLGIGLGLGALAPGLVWAGEEVAYRTGLLFEEDGSQVPNYGTHFLIHRVSGGVSLALLAGSAGSLFLAKRRAAEPQVLPQSNSRPRVSLAIAPGSLGLRGTF